MSANGIQPPASECRLCGGGLEYKFSKIVLNKYDVNYYKCNECHSLQTETPYWLTEAYQSNLSNLDTGSAQRNIQNLVAVYTISKLLKLRNIVEVGGGDGLLCRLLRDYELNCFVNDKYAKSSYAQGYSIPNFAAPDLVIAFEVLEHYPYPREEIDHLFSYNPRVLVVTTALYQDQSNEWWYLAPESGQHIFFYSRTALERIAKNYGYELMASGGFIIFSKNDSTSSFRRKILHSALRGAAPRLIKMILLNRPTPGVWKDHLHQIEISKRHVNSEHQKTDV